MSQITIHRSPTCSQPRKLMGARHCRPSEKLIDLLPQDAFNKENGDRLVSKDSRHV